MDSDRETFYLVKLLISISTHISSPSIVTGSPNNTAANITTKRRAIRIAATVAGGIHFVWSNGPPSGHSYH